MSKKKIAADSIISSEPIEATQSSTQVKKSSKPKAKTKEEKPKTKGEEPNAEKKTKAETQIKKKTEDKTQVLAKTEPVAAAKPKAKTKTKGDEKQIKKEKPETPTTAPESSPTEKPKAKAKAKAKPKADVEEVKVEEAEVKVKKAAVKAKDKVAVKEDPEPQAAPEPAPEDKTEAKTKAKRKKKTETAEIVEAVPVKPSRRRIPKAVKVDIEQASDNTDKNEDEEQAFNPFAKYNDIIEENEKQEEISPKKVRPSKKTKEEKPKTKDEQPVNTDEEPQAQDEQPEAEEETETKENETTVEDVQPKSKGGRGKRKEDKITEYMIDDASASISQLTKGNVWASDVDEIYDMLLEGRRTEHWSENEQHYMNIIRPVFDIRYFNKEDKEKTAALENDGFKTFQYPTTADANNGIAIRKHKIKKITDLTMENILHLEASDVLKLIKENLGTGWKGLPLAIQDIIETAFYVDQSSLPEAAMHRTGGIIDRRKEDGYEVLEIQRGTWIEAVFLKYKPRMEKMHFESISERMGKSDEDFDEEDDNDDINDDNDNIDDNDDDDDDDNTMDEEPSQEQIEEFENIADESEDE